MGARGGRVVKRPRVRSEGAQARAGSKPVPSAIVLNHRTKPPVNLSYDGDIPGPVSPRQSFGAPAPLDPCRTGVAIPAAAGRTGGVPPQPLSGLPLPLP